MPAHVWDSEVAFRISLWAKSVKDKPNGGSSESTTIWKILALLATPQSLSMIFWSTQLKWHMQSHGPLNGSPASAVLLFPTFSSPFQLNIFFYCSKPLPRFWVSVSHTNKSTRHAWFSAWFLNILLYLNLVFCMKRMIFICVGRIMYSNKHWYEYDFSHFLVILFLQKWQKIHLRRTVNLCGSPEPWMYLFFL